MRGARRQRLMPRIHSVLLGVAALALVVVAGASAQDPGPAPDLPADAGVACQEATDQDVGCDTEYTPVAKDPAEGTWDHVGGALFDDGGELVEGSPVPA